MLNLLKKIGFFVLLLKRPVLLWQNRFSVIVSRWLNCLKTFPFVVLCFCFVLFFNFLAKLKIRLFKQTFQESKIIKLTSLVFVLKILFSIQIILFLKIANVFTNMRRKICYLLTEKSKYVICWRRNPYSVRRLVYLRPCLKAKKRVPVQGRAN